MKTITIKITNKEKEHLLNNSDCFEDSCYYVRGIMLRLIKELKEKERRKQYG